MTTLELYSDEVEKKADLAVNENTQEETAAGRMPPPVVAPSTFHGWVKRYACWLLTGILVMTFAMLLLYLIFTKDKAQDNKQSCKKVFLINAVGMALTLALSVIVIICLMFKTNDAPTYPSPSAPEMIY